MKGNPGCSLEGTAVVVGLQIIIDNNMLYRLHGDKKKSTSVSLFAPTLISVLRLRWILPALLRARHTFTSTGMASALVCLSPNPQPAHSTPLSISSRFFSNGCYHTCFHSTGYPLLHCLTLVAYCCCSQVT